MPVQHKQSVLPDKIEEEYICQKALLVIRLTEISTAAMTGDAFTCVIAGDVFTTFSPESLPTSTVRSPCFSPSEDSLEDCFLDFLFSSPLSLGEIDESVLEVNASFSQANRPVPRPHQMPAELAL